MQPRVVMSGDVWDRIMAYTLNTPNDAEINGFGYVDTYPGVIYVNQVFILKQVVTAGSAVTDDAALGAHVYSMIQAGIPQSALRLQWHSHVWGGAYCSGRDTATIEDFPGDWLVSLVVNKHGHRFARLDRFENGMRTASEVPVEVVRQLSDELMRETAQEIAELVRRPGNKSFLRRGEQPVSDGTPGTYDLLTDPPETGVIGDGEFVK
jgi:hypothetical protein